MINPLVCGFVELVLQWYKNHLINYHHNVNFGHIHGFTHIITGIWFRNIFTNCFWTYGNFKTIHKIWMYTISNINQCFKWLIYKVRVCPKWALHLHMYTYIYFLKLCSFFILQYKSKKFSFLLAFFVPNIVGLDFLNRILVLCIS